MYSILGRLSNHIPHVPAHARVLFAVRGCECAPLLLLSVMQRLSLLSLSRAKLPLASERTARRAPALSANRANRVA